MTPQENDMLATLLGRLNQTPAGAKDADAETMVRQAVAGRPDLPYLLAQTVLIQDLALKQAQDRLTEAERNRPRDDGRQTRPGSFLGGLLGRGADRNDPNSSAAASPSFLGGQSMPQGSSFLRSAAATAAGVAGGALLFQGIQSMFGQEAAAGLAQHAGLSESAQPEPAAEPDQETGAAADAGDPGFSDDELL